MSIEKSEPRDEREISAELELTTGPLLPGGKLVLAYKRLHDRRVERLTDDIVEFAGTDTDTFVNRLESDDGVADLFTMAAEQAYVKGDTDTRETLARLVAAALKDNARIHEVSYLLKRLASFDPIHIRVVMALPSAESLAGEISMYEHSSFVDRRQANEAEASMSGSLEHLAALVNAGELVTAAALGELKAWHFTQDRRVNSIVINNHHQSFTQWSLSQFGQLMYDIIGDIDRGVSDGRRR